PLLFAPAFPEVPREALHALIPAGRMLAESIFVFDAVIDESADRAKRASDVAKGQSLQLEAIRMLVALFPGESRMWTALREDFIAYFSAIRAERELTLDTLDEPAALAIARGKAAVARSCVSALGILGQREELAVELAKLVTEFYLARQMWDDIVDWRRDLASGQSSLLLARTIQSLPSDSARDLHTVGATLYYEHHAEYVLALGATALGRARAGLAELDLALPFGRLLEGLDRQLAETRSGLAEMLDRKRLARGARALTLPDRPAACAASSELLWPAAGWLAAEAPRAFAEARHWIRFPADMGLRSALFQSGDVFQRAVIADALCDLPDAVAGSFAPVVAHEHAYVMGSRVCARCGWSYLTELVEEPADADTLAQVLQLAVRTGQARRADFDAPLELLFEANAHPDGSFETWILPPPAERDELHQRQAELVASAWGQGPDPEVMANLLYALSLWDPDRFATRITAGIRFLLERQHPNGAWTASWYWGPFYSTYVHVRLLARAPEGAAAVCRAARALLEGQGRDGAWSYCDVARPLDTAHAVLALLAAHPVARADHLAIRSAVARGLTALHDARLADGGWPADPFIRMDCGRAAGVRGHELSFGSRTLTTAYVLKAAATALRVLDGLESAGAR
ncbi:MAG: hypothetical protein ABI678_21270, partial [Kofleriaceae bacterium]